MGQRQRDLRFTPYCYCCQAASAFTIDLCFSALHYLPAVETCSIRHDPFLNMDDSNRASPPLSSPPQPDHVNLRVTYLVTGNPRPPHSLGNIALNTTISTLKEKIRNGLPEHPSPSDQRLIYQGRPLLRNEATLRDVLRIEVCSESSNLFCDHF